MYNKSRRKAATANDIYQKVLSIKDRLLPEAELYRIFYYDAVPDPRHNPVFVHPVDGTKVRLLDGIKVHTHLALFDALKKKEFLAFRYGNLSYQGWEVRRPMQLIDKVNAGGRIEREDFSLRVMQKAVDIKIGVDIAELATKRLIDYLIIVAGDSDLVPAMKFARKEGIRVFLATLGHGVSSSMVEHSDRVLRAS